MNEDLKFVARELGKSACHRGTDRSPLLDDGLFTLCLTQSRATTIELTTAWLWGWDVTYLREEVKRFALSLQKQLWEVV